MGVCSFCLGDEDKNAEGIPEDMIHCANCGNSGTRRALRLRFYDASFDPRLGHPSCLHYSAKLVEKIQTLRWQCLDCKRCIVCKKGDDSVRPFPSSFVFHGPDFVFQLLFCDLCDTAIHPKCCDPPLHHVPKGDFACDNCRADGSNISKRKSTSTRTPQPSKKSSAAVITRPVAQLIDGMSNFFLPNKDKMKNQQRQQSVQKAMKYLRNQTSNSKLIKRLQTTSKKWKSTATIRKDTYRNQLLARSILDSSKTTRIRRKPANLGDTSPRK